MTKVSSREDSGRVDVFKHMLMLEALEKPDFFFIQIGAHDGITFDAICNFAKRFSWKGLVLEPQPRVFERLVKNYKTCPDVKPLNLAVFDHDGQADLFHFKSGRVPEHATMLASFSKDFVTNNGHGYKYDVTSTSVTCVTLPTLIDQQSVRRIDLLQIDTEGCDASIIRQMLKLPDHLLPHLVRFEAAMLPAELDKLEGALVARGYLTIFLEEFGAPDLIATRRRFDDFAERKVPIRYPSKTLPNSTLVGTDKHAPKLS